MAIQIDKLFADCSQWDQGSKRGTVLEQGCQVWSPGGGCDDICWADTFMATGFHSLEAVGGFEKNKWCEVRLEGWIMNLLLVERENARTPKPIQTNTPFQVLLEGNRRMIQHLDASFSSSILHPNFNLVFQQTCVACLLYSRHCSRCSGTRSNKIITIFSKCVAISENRHSTWIISKYYGKLFDIHV